MESMREDTFLPRYRLSIEILGYLMHRDLATKTQKNVSVYFVPWWQKTRVYDMQFARI
jgi:hypothetical protein